MTTEPSAVPVVLPPDQVTDAMQRGVLQGAAVAAADVRVIRVSGPRVVDCLQGLLTNDVAARGSDGFVWGAFLTPKGMIISDLWVWRDGGDATLFVPAPGAPGVLDVLTRFVPPRLARHEDRSEVTTVLRLVGPAAPARARAAGLAVPEAGRGATATAHGVAYTVQRPPLEQPFALQIACAPDAAAVLLDALEAHAVPQLDGRVLELARVLYGWARAGVEIDAKTLPQEVRFDDLDGVSYTKGCYTGQETVARVHFRGHANRWLCGLSWNSAPQPTQPDVVRGGKTVGRVTSIACLPSTVGWIGLGIVRREVQPGEPVVAAGEEAEVARLPFEPAA